MSMVSVVVATYRREDDLKRALDSLAAQSYSDTQIVLVDDNGDADWNQRVSGIVDAFRERHPQASLKYVVNDPNQGSAKTRNIGIEAADGEYITFLDDDDVYLPDKVALQLAFMQEGGYDYSITDLVLYNEDDKEIDRRVRSYIEDTRASSLLMYHLKYHMTGTDTMMFKKEYLTRIGGFAPIDVGDEFYLMERAITGGGSFGYLPGCRIKAYVHTGEGGLSSGDGKIKGENALYAYKKTHFDQLRAADIRYVKMRHFAVIAYALLRQKSYGGFVCHSLRAFLVSPLGFLRMLKDRSQG